MSKFYLGKTSLSNLEGVHPDMVLVVKRAIQITPIDFGVTEGVRTIETQKNYVAEGSSTTMNSMHLPQKSIDPDDSTEYSWAVDLYCRDDKGTVTWKHEWFRLVVQAMMTAAILEGVPIKSGALWRTFQDSPHFELDRAFYK